MRIVLPLLLSALLAACASHEPQPAAKPAASAKSETTVKAPQCWSGDDGKFFDVGQKAKVAGIEVVCTATADGKNAQWMGGKHK